MSRSPQQRKRLRPMSPTVAFINPNIVCKFCDSPGARTATCPYNFTTDPLKLKLTADDIKEHRYTAEDDIWADNLENYFRRFWENQVNSVVTPSPLDSLVITRNIINKLSGVIQFPNIKILDINEYYKNIENFGLFVYGAQLGAEFNSGENINILNAAIYQYSIKPDEGWRAIVNGIQYFLNS